MNRLTSETRAKVLHLLCEGSSIRAVTRLTGIDKGAVIKLMIDAGKACAAYHDEHVRNLHSKRVQVDEIWSFTYAKQKNVAREGGSRVVRRYLDVDGHRCRHEAHGFVARGRP